ncbi:MAG TPA: hypothetical protein PK735_12275 [Flavobacteriales bacterium]|nr:hypothetical protein [Flavobacteriales bacterium]
MKTTDRTTAPAREFDTKRLADIVAACKEDGLHVWTFGSESSRTIRQVFITDGEKIASVEDSYGLRLSTVHKPNRECGTGFADNTVEAATPQMIRSTMATIAPRWATAKQRAAVVKYKNWEDFLSKDTVLDWYQL